MAMKKDGTGWRLRIHEGDKARNDGVHEMIRGRLFPVAHVEKQVRTTLSHDHGTIMSCAACHGMVEAWLGAGMHDGPFIVIAVEAVVDVANVVPATQVMHGINLAV